MGDQNASQDAGGEERAAAQEPLQVGSMKSRRVHVRKSRDSLLKAIFLDVEFYLTVLCRK
jgi:hypothetical protein